MTAAPCPQPGDRLLLRGEACRIRGVVLGGGGIGSVIFARDGAKQSERLPPEQWRRARWDETAGAWVISPEAA